MRQIALDTETTGLNTKDGHRIIEIGCIELVNRRLTGNHFHCYLNPEREVEASAIAIHGITNEFLKDKGFFKDIVNDFLNFIQGAELIIHNAAFDVGFINHELQLCRVGNKKIQDSVEIIDTLLLARQMHPGQKNNLDALCNRYQIDNSHRQWHGALLDAEILARVYLAMTGKQENLFQLDEAQGNKVITQSFIPSIRNNRKHLKVISATEEEMDAHEVLLNIIEKKSENGCLWLELNKENEG